MDWKEVSGLLAKANRFLDGNFLGKKTVIEAVFTTLNFKLDQKQIKLKDKIAYLNVPPIVKAEIFLNKQKILELCEQAAPGTVKDVK